MVSKLQTFGGSTSCLDISVWTGTWGAYASVSVYLCCVVLGVVYS